MIDIEAVTKGNNKDVQEAVNNVELEESVENPINESQQALNSGETPVQNEDTPEALIKRNSIETDQDGENDAGGI